MVPEKMSGKDKQVQISEDVCEHSEYKNLLNVRSRK